MQHSIMQRTSRCPGEKKEENVLSETVYTGVQQDFAKGGA